jgi:hypothetical protein
MLFRIIVLYYVICVSIDELFDGESLLAIQSADSLRSLRIPLGPIQKIMKIIAKSKMVSYSSINSISIVVHKIFNDFEKKK